MVRVLVEVEQQAEGCDLLDPGPRVERCWEGGRDDPLWHDRTHGFQPPVCMSVCVGVCM